MSSGFRLIGAIVSGALLCFAEPVASQPVAIDVQVEGLPGTLRDNVLAMLSVSRYRDQPGLTETSIRRLHARAPDEIRAALRPFGYYAPTIDAALSVRNGRWRARYTINAGEPVRVAHVEIIIDGPGASDAAFAPPSTAPRRGERLLHPKYEALKQHYLTTAADRGYLDAAFTLSELRVSAAAQTADMELHFTTGERYRFGPITLEQDILDDAFVERYVSFEEGDHYSIGDLLSLQYALTDSEYFTLVEVDARREAAEGLAVPVTVRMEPRRRHRYTAGVGYATDTGPRVLAGWENRRINSLGHRVSADLEVSAVRYAFNTRYVIPLKDPVWERLTIAANVLEEELGDVESSRAELVIAHTKRNGRWQQTLAGRLSRERDLLAGTQTYVTQFVPQGSWLYSGGETGVRARDGFRLGIDVAASDEFLGAPTRFLQLKTRLRTMHPVGERDRLLLRIEVGTTFASNADLLPSSQRFFAGGDASVRGYRYNELGTVDANGNVVGGKHLLTGSAEYEHWFNERWGAAVFVDAGNAFRDFGDSVRKSAGVGLRWGLPFAVVALDVAQPIADPNDSSIRFHLTLGVDL